MERAQEMELNIDLYLFKEKVTWHKIQSVRMSLILVQGKTLLIFILLLSGRAEAVWGEVGEATSMMIFFDRHEHHDIIPVRWGFDCNEYGGILPVTKSHHLGTKAV